VRTERKSEESFQNNESEFSYLRRCSSDSMWWKLLQLFSVELEGAIYFHIVKFIASLNVTWQAFALATSPTLKSLARRLHTS